MRFVTTVSVCLLLAGCQLSQDAEDATANEAMVSASDGSAGALVPNRYIVVLREDRVRDVGVKAVAADLLSGTKSAKARRVYEHALKGFSAEMSADTAASIAKDPRVAYVEQDRVVSVNAVQTDATWGIDRIDQRDLPLSTTYNHGATGAGVHAYIIDTGIRATHQEYAGRASASFDAINDGQNGNDCQGHGSHVAGTVGGTTYGVAKNVTLHAVRVLGCNGSGTWEGVIAGVDWVTKNHVKPAVANMSLGGGVSQATDDAVANSIAAGVTYALAAGNSNADACKTSPARTPTAITVGSTTRTDARSSFSNLGACVDIFAPGSDIRSAAISTDTAAATMSGTSMASPHVCGAAALYLETNPTATPAQVAEALVAGATSDKVTNPGAGSPNKLLFTGNIGR